MSEFASAGSNIGLEPTVARDFVSELERKASLPYGRNLAGALFPLRARVPIDVRIAKARKRPASLL